MQAANMYMYITCLSHVCCVVCHDELPSDQCTYKVSTIAIFTHHGGSLFHTLMI